MLDAEFDTFFRNIPEDWYEHSDGDQNLFRWFGVVYLGEETLGMLDEMNTEGISVPEFSEQYYFVNIYDSGTVYVYLEESSHTAYRSFESDSKGYSDFLAETEEMDYV